MHSTLSIMYGVAKWRELGVVKYEVWNRDWVGVKCSVEALDLCKENLHMNLYGVHAVLMLF